MVVIKQRQIRVNGLAGDTVYNRRSGGSLDESKRGSSGGLDDRLDQTPLRIILNRCEYSKSLKPLFHQAFFVWCWGRYLRWVQLKLIYDQQANT